MLLGYLTQRLKRVGHRKTQKKKKNADRTGQGALLRELRLPHLAPVLVRVILALLIFEALASIALHGFREAEAGPRSSTTVRPV